jgi:hypothetical protein
MYQKVIRKFIKNWSVRFQSGQIVTHESGQFTYRKMQFFHMKKATIFMKKKRNGVRNQRQRMDFQCTDGPHGPQEQVSRQVLKKLPGSNSKVAPLMTQEVCRLMVRKASKR